MKKRIVISTTNDIATDQRMQKFARTLSAAGYDVHWQGRKRKDSLPVITDYFTYHRMVLWFSKGPFFYFFFNLRLTLRLLFTKTDLLLAVDTDTVLANFAVSKLKRIPLVIDCHEYFTGVPELNNRPRVQKIWKAIEKFVFSRNQNFITVNHSLKNIFEKEYAKEFLVVKNLPVKNNEANLPATTRNPEPGNPFTVIYQGAVNKDRGLEELIDAFQKLPGNFRLLIAGDGDIKQDLVKKVNHLSLQKKITFHPRVSPGELRWLTQQCHLGISAEKDTNINYRFSLPNKIFDYIHAGIPVLVSPLPEMKKIVDEYKCGETIDSFEPGQLAEQVSSFHTAAGKHAAYSAACEKAAATLSWQTQEENIIAFFYRILPAK